ncbi:MAG: DUF3667 domain-containing protein [Cyclobacteriaceae bacterium]
MRCDNCSTQFSDSYKYCPECGQKANDELTIGVLFSNTISNYFSVDARFFKSFVPLLIKPGYLASKFVEGRRMTFLHPAQFYLFISVVFFFLFSFEARKQQQQFDDSLEKGFEMDLSDSIKTATSDSATIKEISDQLNEKHVVAALDSAEKAELDSLINNPSKGANVNFSFDRNKLDSLISINASTEEKLKSMGMEEDAPKWQQLFFKQMLKFYEQQGGGLLEAFYDTIPIALFILLPIFAILLKLLFFKKGSFSHHLVFSFYYFSFLFTAFSVLLLLNFIFDLPDWIDNLIVFATWIYLLIGIMRFYGQGFWKSLWKTAAATFTYMIIVLPISMVVMLLISFMLY